MDIAAFDLLLGAGLALGSATVAWVAGRRSGRAAAQRAAAAGPALECSCGHGFGTHEDAGTCSGSTRRSVPLSSYSEPQGWEWVPCPCHVYDGPEPLPRSWSLATGLFHPTMPGPTGEHRSIGA